ncbi:MAG TPA: cation transporter [Actinomycetota bacterium]|nr:cation transporter [Actinomycetota bacterium]
MKPTHRHELPADKRRTHARAVRLEWVTLLYLASAIVFIRLTMGASQAMKVAWLEDMLSLIPAVAFLIASRVRNRAPDERHPYGWHRAISIAYLISAVALLVMGAVLLLDSIMKLVAFEHPTIGTVTVWGHHVWLGWLMIPAAVWSAVPAMVLGRMKLPLARELHDKVLFADAKMNKADWLTGMAAGAGVLGIAFGLWWADAVAAAIISADILHDGLSNVRNAVADLMDTAPATVDGSGRDPLPARVETEMRRLPWVAEAKARLREEGHVFFGEVFVVPRDGRVSASALDEAAEMLTQLDWRLHDVVVAPVADLSDHVGEGPEVSRG